MSADSSSADSFDAALQHLRDVRLSLLRLHKALLHSERVEYEQFFGRIPTNGEFFRLVISHEWFDWLRPVSQFIVQIDDVVNSKDPVSLEQVTDLLTQSRSLLQPDAEGTPPEKRYYRAIQRDPDIALMHCQFTKLVAADHE